MSSTDTKKPSAAGAEPAAARDHHDDAAAAARAVHKVQADKIKPGDLMAIVHFVRVREVAPDHNSIKVHAVDGREGHHAEMNVVGRTLIEDAFSADQFSEEVKVSMTRAAEVLIASHNRPLTVCFVKQGSKRTGEGAGEERVLRGRLIEPNGLLGRSLCEDLDLPEDGNRLREVDHRTIRYLIVDGVKYVVK